MASIRKLPSGLWQAQITRKGVRKSKSFPSKSLARDWAASEERAILGHSPDAVMFGDVLQRYLNDVSGTKRGYLWERGQITRLKAHWLASKRIGDITSEDIGKWRDERLQTVKTSTVRRERNLLSAIFNHARREWKMIAANPVADVRFPAPPPPRDRLPTPDEIERMAYVAGGVDTIQGRAFHAFLFACETGMRAGEIVGLHWRDISLSDRVAHLPVTKNGTARDVPLSGEAVRLLEALPGSDPAFGLTSSQLEANFRKVRRNAGVEGLTFHDSRHRAITMLARKVDVLTLARIVGHKNISQLMVYYNESAADIAKRL